MINSRKKGFTLVELVIVIAVVAILAAVLIPTFTSLIQKANMSSDEVAVRNMNTILATEEIEQKFESLSDVFEALSAAGFSAENYKALSQEHSFYWIKELNRVVLVNKDKNIIYPTNLEGNLEYNADSWFPLFSENRIFPTDAPKAEVSLYQGDIFEYPGQYYTFRTMDTNNSDASQYFIDQRETYGNWWADFTIIINDEFHDNTGGIAGSYWGMYASIPVQGTLYPGQEINLLDLIEGGGYFTLVTYEVLLLACQPDASNQRDGFHCGAYSTSPQNKDKSITVQLRLYKPTYDDNNNPIRGEYIVCEEIECKFD